jgi:predicted nuclease of restriction endonuclease-like RecB superfamily
MKDLREQLEQLRTGAFECQLISDLAADLEKQELFARLAEHLSILASEVEQAIAANVSGNVTERPEG